MRTVYLLIGFFIPFCFFSQAQTTKLENEDFANLISRQLGAKVHSYSDHDTLHRSHNIIDDRLGQTGIWRMHHKKEHLHWVVIELHKTKVLTTFGFNTVGLDEDKCHGVTANYVSIHLSTKGPKTGYKEVGNIHLKKNKNHQIVTIAAQEARWVMLKVENNYGCTHFTELSRVYAYNDVSLQEYEATLTNIGYLDVQDILFESGSAKLNHNESMPHIEMIADIMKQKPGMRIAIEGHTDDVGTHNDNHLLSLKRAQAVKLKLINLGVESSRIKAVGHGSKDPLEHNHSEEGRARNRRVTFRVIK